MADTTPASGSVVSRWDDQYFAEYIRDSGFKPYMGTGPTAIIQVREDFVRQRGQTINIPLVTRLKGSGVTGSTVLEGNEEALGNYNWGIPINTLRHGVVVDEWQEQQTEIALRNAARDMLKMWSMDALRGGVSGQSLDGIIEALGAIYNGTTYSNYADATEAAKDTWQTNNSDRVLYGAATSNASGDSSVDLAKVDSTNDKLTPAAVSLMKRLAKAADPHIRPVRTNGGREFFVMFTGQYAFRDLKQDSTMTQANREARERDVNSNPLFQDGDLVWDGVIIREIPEIGVLSGVGNGSIDVQPAYLCGQQALGLVYGQRPTSRTQVNDYGFRNGVAIQEMRGIRKNYFNNVQHGVVTGYFAGVAD